MSQEWDYPPPRWKRERVGARFDGRVIEHEGRMQTRLGRYFSAAAFSDTLKLVMRLAALFFIGSASFAATIFFYFLIKGLR